MESTKIGKKQQSKCLSYDRSLTTARGGQARFRHREYGENMRAQNRHTESATGNPSPSIFNQGLRFRFPPPRVFVLSHSAPHRGSFEPEQEPSPFRIGGGRRDKYFVLKQCTHCCESCKGGKKSFWPGRMRSGSVMAGLFLRIKSSTRSLERP